VEQAGSLDAVLRPRSVAVVGASRREGSIGREILKNLVQFGFQGPVYPVHPDARHILSIRAWPTLAAIPDTIDLAVIAVPAGQVLEVIQACAACGVRGVVVITAGFREVGPAGRALEDEIVALVRAHGMRMVGPNCMGLINADPAVRLDASFSATLPLEGGAAFASQSGALGEVVLATARSLGLGISQFVSLGNKADVSGNDLLAFWADDPRTRVILLYLESFGNPRRFAMLARQVTRERGKPVLAVKSGRTRQGAAAAQSHTGSLAGGDRAATALFKSCGVIRCNTVAELFALGRGFVHQPLPPGPRVAVLTNAGGPGIMATDAAVHFGLTMATLSAATEATLTAALPPEASVHNPVDMIASATPAQYQACAEALLADPGVDGLLVIFVSPVVTDPLAVADAIVQGTRGARGEKPVLACFMGRAHGDEGIERLAAADIPSYPFPESAAQTLAAMAHFRAWRAQPAGAVRRFEVDQPRAAALIAAAEANGQAWLDTGDALEVLEAYGIPTAASLRVHTPEEAIAFAAGQPVVLKVEVPEIIHKSDIGGVRVDLRTPGEIKGAFWDLREALTARGITDCSYRVQQMLSGRETIIGAAADPSVGHLIMFGLGGVFVELMEDVAFAVHPLTDADSHRMLRAVKGWPLLAGYRGADPVDVALLEEVVLRVNQLVADFPQIAEMDLNPFIAAPVGRPSAVVDARVRLAGAPWPV